MNNLRCDQSGKSHNDVPRKSSSHMSIQHLIFFSNQIRLSLHDLEVPASYLLCYVTSLFVSTAPRGGPGSPSFLPPLLCHYFVRFHSPSGWTWKSQLLTSFVMSLVCSFPQPLVVELISLVVSPHDDVIVPTVFWKFQLPTVPHFVSR